MSSSRVFIWLLLIMTNSPKINNLRDGIGSCLQRVQSIQLGRTWQTRTIYIMVCDKQETRTWGVGRKGRGREWEREQEEEIGRRDEQLRQSEWIYAFMHVPASFPHLIPPMPAFTLWHGATHNHSTPLQHTLPYSCIEIFSWTHPELCFTVSAFSHPIVDSQA